MTRIECICCNETIRVNDYDFARFSKGEFILCENCYNNFRNNKTKLTKC